MTKRIIAGFLMAMLLVQSMFTGSANAANAFNDISGHWAQKSINELASLGIVKGNTKKLFYPESPISRGEALAMLNRVFDYVYGPVAKPVRKENIDYRYQPRWEIEQLLTNMNTMLQIETGVIGEYDPGDRMLYYLFLSDSGKLIKKPEKQNPEWWLSSSALQRPLSREEASVIFFHMLTPQIFRTANIKPQDAASYFTSYYEWKQESYYRDTYSPYATAIREFNLFTSPTTFNPDKKMTRAEYAVVLKRLLDYYKKQAVLQFQAKGVPQQKISTAFLRAANLAFETKNQAKLLKYYTPAALTSMGKLGLVPLHTDLTGLTVKVDETDGKKLWLIAQYKVGLHGSYQIEYRLDPDPTSTYGRKIAAVVMQK
ncbi:S-layer homology domain-containing protein [Brevibacillus choshinensis]|uniref:S-layer homology domain-containing protein n=1 Tax=Brevibacillus choshinensis TaxID=54911 RepID=UPI002E21E040|nr:S-layer homology domain-containing protein [Brevibacillus choshinensis]